MFTKIIDLWDDALYKFFCLFDTEEDKEERKRESKEFFTNYANSTCYLLTTQIRKAEKDWRHSTDKKERAMIRAFINMKRKYLYEVMDRHELLMASCNKQL